MVILKMSGYNRHSRPMSNLPTTTGYDIVDVVGLKDEKIIKKLPKFINN